MKAWEGVKTEFEKAVDDWDDEKAYRLEGNSDKKGGIV